MKIHTKDVHVVPQIKISGRAARAIVNFTYGKTMVSNALLGMFRARRQSSPCAQTPLIPRPNWTRVSTAPTECSLRYCPNFKPLNTKLPLRC